MDDLIAFLRAQLDEDERIARAVRVPPYWHQGPGDDPEWTDEELVCMWPPEFHTPYERDKHWRGLTVEGPELAEHIATHDPTRVLREIDAKRQLLARGGPFCTSNCDDPDSEPKNPDTNWTTPLEHHFDCAAYQAAQLLALPYTDRPGFREDWRP
jgi:hypothetical protein